MEDWDPVAFKTLLRTTSQRLGQLQERKDAQGKLARRDIATLLSQGHVALARARAATLIQEDMMGDLLEQLEMFVGTLGRHAGELGSGGRVGLGLREDEKERTREEGELVGSPRLSPVVVEAAASIIYAARSTDAKDLHAVRDILIKRLGPAFAQAASASRNNNVSPRITRILSAPPPSASKMDEYLAKIAQTYGVGWMPEPRREDMVNVISEIVSADVGSSPIVDLPRLRGICARGLPDNPSWVRPRVWRLLLGTLPVLKSTWVKENRKQRDSYYDLVRRLLAPFASLPPPTDTLSSTDALLLCISDSLFNVSPDLYVLLGNEPKSMHSSKSPLDPSSPDSIRIPCTSNLDKRLALLKGDNDISETPEIRLESDLNGSTDPTLSTPPSSSATRRQRHPTTLLPSKPYNAPPAHRAHLSALLRLLYIHSALNPAVQSPHIPSLLVPLYSALAGETNEDVAHAEADTFWVFEALVGEIAEMEEEEGGKTWRRKLSERVRWADGELAASLHTTGLDPVLPHYSYRWLAPLLAQTLPVNSVLPIWDALFARPMRTRDVNQKLEYLVDICTALLIRARTPLFRLGKPGQNAPGLWTQEHAMLSPPSPLRPWELSDAFTEGLALLTSYPIDAAGGIDRILQTAADLAQKRMEATDREKERQRQNVGFGARITQQMWKGFTNHVPDESPEEEEEEEEEEKEEDKKEDEERTEHDDGNETETPAMPTLTSRLATTVWRGITNQSSMDDEVPSPPSPLSEQQSPTLEKQEISPADPIPTSPSSQASLWDYAGKLKDSDAIAAFSKVSSNWRAKALDAWRVRKESGASASSLPAVTGQLSPSSVASDTPSRPRNDWPGLRDPAAPSHRRGSLPGTQRESIILDPPRPSFFRSPRESFLPQPRRQHATAPPSPSIKPPTPFRDSDNESSASSFIHRAGSSIASLATFQPSHSTPKSVPRPLMLSSRDLMANKTSRVHSSARSDGGMPVAQWTDVSLNKNRHALRQESISSTSSLSPSEALNRSSYAFSSPFPRSASAGPRSDYDSDGSASRRVPLNRKSVSPMALASRSPNLPWNVSPSAGRSSGHPLSNGSMTAEELELASERGVRHSEEQVPLSASTTTSVATAMSMGLDSPMASPPIPPTPLMSAVPGPGVVCIVNGERGHGGTSSISTLSEAIEANAVPLEPPTQNRLVRKKTPPLPVPAMPSRDGRREALASPSESEQSELSMERTPLGKAPARLRSKRYAPRPGNLRLRPVGPGVSEQRQQRQRTPSPGQRNLAPEWPSDGELATTPKGGNYSSGVGEEGTGETVSAASRPPFVRKPSKETRVGKGLAGTRRARDSASGAEEGDDEGYDALLSTYESEEESRE